MRFELIKKDIADPWVVENFDRIQIFINDSQLIQGSWRFFQYSFTQNATNLKISHDLGFVPLDLIQTSARGLGAIVWNYNGFTATQLDVTISGTPTVGRPLIVRGFLGKYPNV